MYTDQLDILSKQAREAMDSGNLHHALQLTREIQSMEEDYIASPSSNRFLINASGLLIDIGNASGNQQTIQEGVDLLRKNFERVASDDKYAATAHYNLGNGYSALFDIKRKQEPFAACFRDTELSLARSHYDRALKYPFENPFVASQVWVNLGNCFDALGMVLDALECYEKAIALKPDHGMALGNKGIGLISYATVSGEHLGTFLIEAYSLISEALRQGVHPEAAPYFRKHLEAIEHHFEGRQHLLDNPPQYPGYRIKAKSKIERFLVEFCLKNKLYLNICNYCQRCDAAVGDTGAIKKMIVPISNRSTKDWLKDEPYLRLSAYLNQIKQDYVTARFLFALSGYKGLNLNFVDKRVKIINTLDYSVHNIYIELVKASFKSFYGILDKIAYFINDYLKLKIHQREVSFRTVWYMGPPKDKRIRKEVQDTNNPSLNALFNLHRDFEEGPHGQLRKTRDALTHRFINIQMFQAFEDEENMAEDTLASRALELAKLVRNAIMYLLYFVYIEEGKKETESKGPIAPMFARELPDNLKSYR